MQRVFRSCLLQRIVIKPPCRGKSYGIKSFCPYRAILFLLTLPRVLPWARSFCPLPFLYHSASDFQFHSAGDRWFRACYWTSDRIAGNGDERETSNPPGSFYLFTFLLLNVPSIYFLFLTFAPETLKEK